jgi:hypothetical protein
MVSIFESSAQAIINHLRERRGHLVQMRAELAELPVGGFIANQQALGQLVQIKSEQIREVNSLLIELGDELTEELDEVEFSI